MIDPNFIRYLHASVSPLIKDTVDPLGLEFFVEGVDAELSKWFRKDSVLLRINGPWIVPMQGETYYRVEIMVMLTDLVNPGENPYRLFDHAGAIAQTLSQNIPIYRHGGDGSLLGCLEQDGNSREFVRIVNFGQIEKDTKVRQMAVIGRYELTV